MQTSSALLEATKIKKKQNKAMQISHFCRKHLVWTEGRSLFYNINPKAYRETHSPMLVTEQLWGCFTGHGQSWWHWRGEGHLQRFTAGFPGQWSISSFSTVYFPSGWGHAGGEFWQGKVLDQCLALLHTCPRAPVASPKGSSHTGAKETHPRTNQNPFNETSRPLIKSFYFTSSMLHLKRRKKSQ